MFDEDPKGFLRAVSMGQTADSRQTTYTFAHMAVQTSEDMSISRDPNEQVPELVS